MPVPKVVPLMGVIIRREEHVSSILLTRLITVRYPSSDTGLPPGLLSCTAENVDHDQ
jgi:hypothetical protein